MMNIEELRKNFFVKMASMLCALKMEILLVITALCVCERMGAALINFCGWSSDRRIYLARR